MDLHQRLRLLRQLQTGLRPQPAPTAPPPPAAGRHGLPAGVTEHASPEGPVWRREQFYPEAHRLGGQPLSAFAELAPSLLAAAAQDSRLAKVAPDRLVLLDTETTGLGSGTGTVPFLVGTARWQDGGLLVRQFFLPGFGHERAMLKALTGSLTAAGGLVTFNGKTFDWPLLTTRFVLQRLPLPLAAAPHLDLLHPSRRLWRRRLGDCSLVNLEREVLGHGRTGDVPGQLIPGVYADWLRQGRPEPLEPVLSHNELDLLALAGLAASLTSALAAVSPALHPLDALSRARWLDDLGQPAAAEAAYRAALAAGLPPAAKPEALRRLALLLRRQGDHAAAARVWAELAETGVSVEAFEALAKHHEHRTGNLVMALQCTAKALRLAAGLQADPAALQHRRRRLLRKLGGSENVAEPFAQPGP